jgi:hypothetical protein
MHLISRTGCIDRRDRRHHLDAQEAPVRSATIKGDRASSLDRP